MARMYLDWVQIDIILGVSYGKYETRTRFKEVLRCLIWSKSIGKVEKVLNYHEAKYHNPGDAIFSNRKYGKVFLS